MPKQKEKLEPGEKIGWENSGLIQGKSVKNAKNESKNWLLQIVLVTTPTVKLCPPCTANVKILRQQIILKNTLTFMFLLEWEYAWWNIYASDSRKKYVQTQLKLRLPRNAYN